MGGSMRSFLTMCLVMGVMVLSERALAWSPENFKKPSDADLKKSLTKIQYQVTSMKARNGPSRTSLMKKKMTAFTSTSFPANRFLARKTNTTPKRVGRAFQLF